MHKLIRLKQAYEYAAKYSTDPRTQNGSVLVPLVGDTIFAANHFPEGVKETPERWEKPLKASFVEHAERNAIFSAARQGFSTKGATLYCPWYACPDCARAIVQSGISQVIGHDAPFHFRPDWQALIDIADTILREAGVDFTRIKHSFGVKIRFDGETVEV